MEFDTDIYTPTPIIIGIFGYTNKVSENDIQDNILTPILEKLERLPDKILIPNEGNSSIYIQNWSESLHIKTNVFISDWSKNGKIAQIIRDDRIAKECTHALVFLSNKTDRLHKLSKKLSKKGKSIFTSSYNQSSFHFQYVPFVHQKMTGLTHDCKSSKETVQTLLKYQKK